MKNSRYFPFERNRFFYGKLLTVRDFESEQKYFNDKRRLVNRLLHGYGVVSGLQVIAVDDKSVSVEMGMALDSLGREIVIPSPVTLKLSTIDGFSNNEYSKNVYLCLAYDEKGREPVHSVANASIHSEEVSEYNRLAEGYRLFVREEPPHPDEFEWGKLFEDQELLYEDEAVRILQTAPKYVNPGEVFDVHVIVEKTLQTPEISMSYELDISDDLRRVDEEDSTIRFNEAVYTEGSRNRYEFSYKLQPGIEYEKRNVVERIGVKGHTIKLGIGDREMEVETEAENQVEVMRGSVKERMINRYFERNLEESVRQTEDQAIYLARIGLIQMGPSYVIERVDPVPFNEYVYTSSMIHRLEEAMRKAIDTNFETNSVSHFLPSDAEPKLKVDYNDDRNLFSFEMGIPRPKKPEGAYATGLYEMKLDPEESGGKGFFVRGGRYLSEKIDHGLGTGHVVVEVGIEGAFWGLEDNISEMASGKGALYFGDFDVFKGTEYELELENLGLGTVVYPEKGNFVVGIRADNVTEQLTLTLRWWAYKKHTQQELMDGEAPDQEETE